MRALRLQDTPMMSPRQSPEAQLREIADQLGEAVYAAIPYWVFGCVENRYFAWSKTDLLPEELRARTEQAALTAQQDAGGRVRAVLALDIDEQQVPPLSLIRQAVKYPTEVLQGAGVSPVVRDEFAERNFPDDIYDLSPASFGEMAAELQELGMAWGAAKAFVHLQRHRPT